MMMMLKFKGRLLVHRDTTESGVSYALSTVRYLSPNVTYTVFRKKHPLLFSCITLRKNYQFQ